MSLVEGVPLGEVGLGRGRAAERRGDGVERGDVVGRSGGEIES